MSDFLSIPPEDRIFLCRHIGEQLGIYPAYFKLMRFLKITAGLISRKLSMEAMPY